MGKAFWKDIRRTLWKSKKRFLSLMVITALGVTVLTGIYASVQDIMRSADQFFDQQQLFDVRVVSRLGLTTEDVQALKQVAGIEAVAGAYSEKVHTGVDGTAKEAEVVVLNGSRLNQPYLVEGTLPTQPGQLAVTRAYLADTGKALGDEVTIEEIMDKDAGTGEVAPALSTPALKEDTIGQGDGNDDSVDWDADTSLEEEPETPTFLRSTFTICGVVLDPTDINNGDLDFRSSGGVDYTFFIQEADVDFEVYTAIYLTLAGLREKNCYSDGYKAAVQQAVDTIEGEIKRQREEARYNAVRAEAAAKITDAETLMDEKFAQADDKIDEAWAKLEDARQQLLEGEVTLTREQREALQKLADAHAKLEDGKRQLDDAEAQLAVGLAALQEGQADYEKGLLEYQAGVAQYEAARQQTQLLGQAVDAFPQLVAAMEAVALAADNTAIGADPILAERFTQSATMAMGTLDGMAAFFAPVDATVSGALSGLSAGAADQLQQGNYIECYGLLAAVMQPSAPGQPSLYDGMSQGVGAALSSLDEAWAALEAGRLTMEAAKAKLDSGWQEYYDGARQLQEARAQLAEGEAQLLREEASALRQLAEGWKELEEGKTELTDGQLKLEENQQAYDAKRLEAKEKLADAWAKLADIDMAQWYVQDRTALGSYASLKSDMSSIQAVGNAFPVVFLVVAILISLTTMARMVEEERGLIGTYKALGFGAKSIYTKYLLYALLACLLGGLLGDILGFVVLPIFLINILQVMYSLPSIFLGFDALYGFGGVLLFMVSIVGATAIACRSELAQVPASLMRPKAPRAGSRIFLERLAFIWNRLGFLNKVTARNLFRYKKRLVMTVLGITGCTALVLSGFAIRDSVTDLMPKQYDIVYRYDLMTVTAPEDNASWVAKLAGDQGIKDSLNLQVDSLRIFGNNGNAEDVQLMVVPTGHTINDYISTQDENGAPVALEDGGLLVTQNAAEFLGLKPGSALTLQNSKLERREATVQQVVQNYLGNMVYMTQHTYEGLFGEYAPNTVLAHYSPKVTDQPAYTESLQKDDRVLTAISIEAQKADFATNFTMINSVVYILTILAAGLAFVVLFTLSNTNISERVRELATIKVLGFYDGEVHAYVNKETLILTLLGIALGLPFGRYISGLLTSALKMPSLYFAVHVQPLSYLWAGVISLCFALVVNLMTNRTLNKINMVEALKSVE